MHSIALRRPLVLASASPRRTTLLTQLQLSFTTIPSDFDEPPPVPGEDLTTWIQRAALDKARAVAQTLPAEPRLILGADTVVVLPVRDGAFPLLQGHPVRVLGKPSNTEEATCMLTALSGRAHRVVSAFALLAHPEGDYTTDVEETRVHFRRLSSTEIAEYIASGEPLDKAGAYGIQGQGAVLVDRIAGDYYTVVGLPLARLWQRLLLWR